MTACYTPFVRPPRAFYSQTRNQTRNIMLFIWAFLYAISMVNALKFMLPAQNRLDREQRCIREFITKDTMVAVRGRTSGVPNDGQKMAVKIKDNKGNLYWSKENVLESFSAVFTPRQDVTVDICLGNTFQDGRSGSNMEREVDLDVEIGAYARDWDGIQASEKLKPAEVDLRRANDVAEEIQKELTYLRVREERLRDTNESTNRRVKNFFVLILLVFVGLGSWQIYYLRAYFRSKHII